MTRMIFVNLPVRDLKKSRAFYEAIGANNNPQFTDATSASMVLSETINIQLLTYEKWKTFTRREIPDAHKTAQVLLAISCEDRNAVHAMNEAAAKNGGMADVNPPQDHGFMISRAFADPDGHIWEAIWMDMGAVSAQ